MPHSAYHPYCDHESEWTHQTGSLYLEQLTDTKYGTLVDQKYNHHQHKLKYLHQKNNQLHHTHAGNF